MNDMRMPLRAKVHHWMDAMGFRLNFSETLKSKDLVFDHYFYKTFAQQAILLND